MRLAAETIWGDTVDTAATRLAENRMRFHNNSIKHFPNNSHNCLKLWFDYDDLHFSSVEKYVLSLKHII